MKKIYLIIPVLTILLGCPLPWESKTSENKKSVEESPFYESIVLTNNTNEDQRALLVLTNYGSNNQEVPLIKVNGSTDYSRNIDQRTIANNSSVEPVRKLDMPLRDDYIREGSSSRSTTLVDYNNYSVGDPHNFWLTTFGGQDYLQEFSLKSKEALLDSDTELELFIWVDSRDTVPGGAIEKINSDFKNIYRDMIAIFGDHWGAHNFSSIISEGTNDIHILFTDIDEDQNSSPQGYVLGYFHGNKDAYSETTARVDGVDTNVSNRNLNLVMDSYLYFNNGDTANWRNDSRSTALTLSTLIHEFQHMIHFYQKDIRNNTNSDFFVNEMFSMVAEDIFAKSYSKYFQDRNGDGINEEYLESPDRGRVPEFNFFWDLQSSFNWDFYENNLNSYSMSYVMGAYIIRNYGIDFFTNYLTHDITGKDGILKSLNSIDTATHTTESLLQNFGLAVIYSMGVNNEKGFRFNNPNGFDILGNNLVPINFFDETYEYFAFSSDKNRLYNYQYEDGWYNAPFYPITTVELTPLTETPAKEFLKESNIYVNLGRIPSGADIEINIYPNEDGSAPTIAHTVLTAPY